MQPPDVKPSENPNFRRAAITPLTSDTLQTVNGCIAVEHGGQASHAICPSSSPCAQAGLARPSGARLCIALVPGIVAQGCARRRQPAPRNLGTQDNFWYGLLRQVTLLHMLLSEQERALEALPCRRACACCKKRRFCPW